MPLVLLALLAIATAIVVLRVRDSRASRVAVFRAELHLDTAELAGFPERIHLTRCSWLGFQHRGQLRLALRALRAQGFGSVALFTIDEFPGVRVALAAHRRESMYAAVTDHPKAGVWIDVVSRTFDGRRWICTTLAGSGLEARSDTTRVSLPGATVAQVVAQARRDRPADGLRRVHVQDTAPYFEQGYADWIAWRKASTAQPRLAIVRPAKVRDGGGLEAA